MNSSKSFYKEIFQVTPAGFNDLALRLFRYQAANSEIYAKYIGHLGVEPQYVEEIDQIPFLPISFFKEQKIVCGEWEVDQVFESSGTTGSSASRHYVRDANFYLDNTVKIFEKYYGDPTQYHIFALLPAYLERTGSSLVLMAEHFLKLSHSPYGGFYLNDYDALIEGINKARMDDDRKILLLGVSFALLDLAEDYKPDLEGVVVMETGGMKGRRKEMIRAELHDTLCKGLNVAKVHSEYGMTELLSQAYSLGNGIFHTPPWMKILLRDINDPFDFSQKRASGGINVIDLANIDSCAFIETQDMGRVVEGGGFEVIGRFDNSDIRGCNLMVY